MAPTECGQSVGDLLAGETVVRLPNPTAGRCGSTGSCDVRVILSQKRVIYCIRVVFSSMVSRRSVRRGRARSARPIAWTSRRPDMEILMTASIPRPPLDPHLENALTEVDPSPIVTPERIPELRTAQVAPSLQERLADRPVVHREARISGHNGDEIAVSVLCRADHRGAGPGMVFTHGGGMILGDRFHGVEVALDWVERFDAVCVTVEYRLAPEFPDPYPVEDCYAALRWTAANAADLGIDPRRLLVAGGSAGGGLAAGTALLARDRGGPALIGQVLMYPMLDDRTDTVSSRQFADAPVWDGTSNGTGWTALLGDRRGTDRVSIYAAPARATDLSGLPPAYVDVGSAELFRDEDVAFASRIWAGGGIAELHVWPGGFHAFDLIAPDSALARAMISTRTAWVGRLLRA